MELEGLDRVDWSGLTHAYGPADDVPGLLRELAAGEDAFDALFGNVWHQGTVYPATAPTIPFLLELLDPRADPPGATALLTLLTCMATGHGYYEVHQHLPFGDPIEDGVLDGERSVVTAAHLAVCAGLDRIAARLAHPEADVRAHAARALGALHGVGARAAAPLLDHLEREGERLVRAVVLDALAGLWWTSEASELVRMSPAGRAAPLDRDEVTRGRVSSALLLPRSTPVERVVAADATLPWTDALPDVEALARDLGDAGPDLGAWGDFGSRRWFQTRPEVSLAVLVARVRAAVAGGDAPRPLVVELADHLASRRLRPEVVGLLVELLRAPSPSVRFQAAQQLRHCGLAVRAHADAVAEAAADPALAPLLARPLCLIGRPEGERIVGEVLRGDDDLVLLFLVEHVTAASPPQWEAALRARATRSEASAEPQLQSPSGLDTWSFAATTRHGGSSLTGDRKNLARRIDAALTRMAGGATPGRKPSAVADAEGEGPPSWKAVDALAARLERTGDPGSVRDSLVRQLVPKPCGRAALELLLPLGLPPSGVPVVEALLADDDGGSIGTVEEDEAFRAGLRQLLG